MSLIETLANNPKYKGVLPADFLHGYASAAYQVEGAVDVDGRGPTTWDVLFKDYDFDGQDACRSYYMWQDDIALLKAYGAKAYRFSISWSRIIPKGGKGDDVNEAGVQYYNKLIDALLEAGIKPVPTLFHYDTPQELEERYQGWTCQRTMDIVEDFVAYAQICFERFGDRVNDWITINEPFIFCCHNYFGLKKDWQRGHFYAIAHRVLLAHGYTAKMYREKFAAKQGGKIGLALNCEWNEPLDDSAAAKQAAEDALARSIGMFADPLYLGKENEIAHRTIGEGHQRFTEEELRVINGSCDYFGINAYGTAWTTGKEHDPLGKFDNDWAIYGGGVDRVFEKDGVPIGKRGKNGHPYIVPWGFRNLLVHCWKAYAQQNNLDIRIFENGYAIDKEDKMSVDEIVDDKERQEFYNGYIQALCDAVVEDGARITTYLAWSLLDNLEWTAGYEPRFGVTFIDKDNGYKRIPKNSSKMMKTLWEHVVAK